MLTAMACETHVGGGAAMDPVELIPLSTEEVRRIADFEGLVRDVILDHPATDDYAPEGPCRAVGDQHIAFGGRWSEFLSVADAGDRDSGGLLPSAVSVVQTVVVYSDDSEAQEVFDGRAADLAECARLGLPGLAGMTTRKDASGTVMVADGLTSITALESAILFEVAVVGLPDSERIAAEISHAMRERIE